MFCITHTADNSVTEQKRLIPHLLLLYSNTPSALSYICKRRPFTTPTIHVWAQWATWKYTSQTFRSVCLALCPTLASFSLTGLCSSFIRPNWGSPLQFFTLTNFPIKPWPVCNIYTYYSRRIDVFFAPALTYTNLSLTPSRMKSY